MTITDVKSTRITGKTEYVDELDIDLISSMLNLTQLDALMVFLTMRKPLTAAAVERNIHCAYIVDFIDTFTLKIRESPPHGNYQEHVNKFINDKKLEEPLKSLVAAYCGSPSDALKDTFRSILITDTTEKGHRVSAEYKRIKIISQINKLSKEADIPSYKRIKGALDVLSTHPYSCIFSEKETLRTSSKTAWRLTPTFLKRWSERRSELFNEFERKKDEYDDESKAKSYFVDKHNSIPFVDFYLIGVNVKPVVHVSKYLANLDVITKYLS